MPVLLNPTWGSYTTNPATGVQTQGVQYSGTSFPAEDCPDNRIKVTSATDETLQRTNTFTIFSLDVDGTYNTLATGVNTYTITEEYMQQIDALFINLDEDLPAGTLAADYAPLFVTCTLSPYYFLESSLYQYITPQQMMQYKAMYPRCVSDAYRTAVGRLTGNVGNLLNMDAILSQTIESKKDDTICWVLQVITAFVICQPSMNISQPLSEAYDEAMGVVNKLRGGQLSLEAPADYRTDSYNSLGEVFSFKDRYIG